VKTALCLLALAAGAVLAADVSDPSIGYTLTLPSHWGAVKPKPMQNYFRDSTRQYHSQISIVRYPINKADYPTPQSWSQAQFIAYKLSVENSVFPFGAVMYYDSTASAKIGDVWSPEAFSVLYPADGDPTYAEFVRYCAVADNGYEIYAIGDSTDMMNNVDFYASVIATFKFSAPEGIRIAAPEARMFPAFREGSVIDAAGRSLPPARPGSRRWQARFPVAGKPGG
jgi:hypothetical protein